MTNLKPQVPFLWPEPRVREGIAIYEDNPPFGELALGAISFFGVISALTSQGVDVLEAWLERNHDLKASVIVAVYPTGATNRSDLDRLQALVERAADRLIAHIWPLQQVTDRSISALCFLAKDSGVVHITAGSSEDLGLDPWLGGHLNFVFRADPCLVEAFKRHFDWLWVNSCEILSNGATAIPDLVLPKGSEEGSRVWQAYIDNLAGIPANDEMPRVVAHVDPETGDVTIESPEGDTLPAPTDQLGITKLDPIAERVAHLYEQGTLVSIDKLSRIPPLDAPLDPSVFGDAAELVRGNVKRTVSLRASVIDKKTLKNIEARRQGLRTLLTKFTFGLADNMRWIPAAARALFEAELGRINKEGQKLISDLICGNVDAFLETKREALVADLNAMYSQLGRPGQVTPDVVAKVLQSMKERLEKAQSTNFMPKLSYSSISFTSTDNAFASPWGQAYSLLSDVAVFPRKAQSDSFFFRGLKTSKKVLLNAMNVADDALLRDSGTLELEDRCKTELDILSRIEKAPIASKLRCELVLKIIDGAPIASIEEELKKRSMRGEADSAGT